MDIYHIPTFAKKSTCLKGYCQFREGPPKKRFFESFPNSVNPPTYPMIFVRFYEIGNTKGEIWVKKGVIFLGVWTLFGNQISPKKRFFGTFPFMKDQR